MFNLTQKFNIELYMFNIRLFALLPATNNF